MQTKQAGSALAEWKAWWPLTLAAIKRALVELSRPESNQDRAAVDALVARCFDSADYKEGQKAFL
ncbi:MAG TPA: hypothetical protein PKE25_10430, partial [Novosphingobium sp.]|nr:hypothetical protein [Novosphingobium sp.]